MKKHLFLAGLLVLVACVPQEMRAGDVSFDPSVKYSRIVIDNCLYHFKANKDAAGFAKYNGSGTQLQNRLLVLTMYRVWLPRRFWSV